MTTRGKKIGVAVVGLLIIAVAVGGYFYYKHKNEEKTVSSQETITVERHDLKASVSATGTIRPVDAVDVSPKITGRIQAVMVKENDRVKTGQTVAVLDGKELAAKQEQAQFKVDNARLKYERTLRLYQEGALSKQALDDAEFEYDSARSRLAETQSDMAETVITAPMDGVVVGEPQTVGSMAVQGNNSPTVIMRIADLSRKQIRAKVDETDIGKIIAGQTAVFTVDAYTGKKFSARVSQISQTDVGNTWSNTASAASVIYYYVILEVEDPENLLKPAMTARVDIQTAEKKNVLAVPPAALKANSNGSYVLVVHSDGSTEERPVTTGIYSSDYVEITSGLEEGEFVSIAYKASADTKKGNAEKHSRQES